MRSNAQLQNLGELAESISNGTTIPQNANGIGLPVSRIETLQDNRFDFSRIKYIADISNENVKKYKYQDGDIALSHINSIEHVGKTAIYNSSDYPELIHGMNLLRIRLKKDIIDPEYFFYYSRSYYFKNDIVKKIKKAVNQVSINQQSLSSLQIPIFPLAKQKQIVSKIKECFTLLDKSEERLQKADNILDRVMDIALISLITKDPSEVYETNIGELVEKKEMIAKRNLATEFEYIEISSISENFEIETTKRYSNSNAPSRARQLVREGNVLYSTVRPNLRRIAIVPQKLNLGICSTGFCNLRPRVDMIRSKYLYYWILRDNFTKEMVSLARGSQYPAVRDKDVLSSRILVPKDLAVQDEIIRKLDMYFNTSVKAKNKLIKVRETVQQLRQSILKKAFEGKLI